MTWRSVGVVVSVMGLWGGFMLSVFVRRQVWACPSAVVGDSMYYAGLDRELVAITEFFRSSETEEVGVCERSMIFEVFSFLGCSYGLRCVLYPWLKLAVCGALEFWLRESVQICEWL